MSRRICVTFSGAAYDETTEKIVTHSPKDTEYWVYDDRWLIESGFVDKHRWLWDAQPQLGFGGCSWKPYIILDAMSRANPGDLLMYQDADCIPIADLTPLWNLCERDGIVLFEETGCTVRHWVRRDCLIQMGCDDERYWGAVIAVGRFQMFKVGGWPHCQQFCELWLQFSTNPFCMLREPSSMAPEHPDFIRACTEQGVLSLLALQYGIPLHRCPDQNGWPIYPSMPKDDYPQLFFQQGLITGNKDDMRGSKLFHVPGANR